MQIIELPPTRLDLPNGGEPCYIAARQFLLSRGKAKTSPGSAGLGPLSRSSRSAGADHAPSLPCCITCEMAAGKVSG